MNTGWFVNEGVSFYAPLNVPVDIPCNNIDENNDGRDFCMNTNSFIYDQTPIYPTDMNNRVHIDGVVNIPPNVNSTNIKITDFTEDTSCNSDGSFSLENEGLLVAFDTSKNQIIYLTYPTGSQVQLNAKETAISLILKMFPFDFSNNNDLSLLKEQIYSIEEVKLLEQAVDKTIHDNGFLKVDNIVTEYDLAINAILAKLNLNQNNDRNKKNKYYDYDMVMTEDYYLEFSNVKVEKPGEIKVDLQALTKKHYFVEMYLGRKVGNDFEYYTYSNIGLIPPLDASAKLNQWLSLKYYAEFKDESFWDQLEALKSPIFPSINIPYCYPDSVIVLSTKSERVTLAIWLKRELSGIGAIGGLKIE
ncbi:MAG: hypothetical protein HQK77_16275 [Desulfobacterales bacterium]|nr:hypothetical protein [Desulfobacterales bacterium]